MWVLLTVDLNNLTDTKKRDAFYEDLKKKKWTKFRATTTTWSASFEDTISAARAVEMTKADVAEAARVAGIGSCDAVCLAGAAKPTVF